MNFSELATTRRSVRKFTEADVNIDEIIECIKIGTTAPSGCNSQCWKFYIVHSKKVINNLVEIISEKQKLFLSNIQMNYDQTYLNSKIKMLTFFQYAPVCIAVCMTKVEYYDKKLEKALYESGYSYEKIMDLYGNPDILSIGAAIQNTLLALHEKGYGACWMNDPIIATEEISKYLNLSSDEKLISFIPIGISAYTPSKKVYKEITEVIKIIE